MKSLFTILTISGWLLVGCAPPQPTSNLSIIRQELAQLRQLQQQQSHQIGQNLDKLLQVEAKIEEQQSLITELRRELATKKVTPNREITLSGYPAVPSGTMPGGSDSSPGSATEIYLKAFSDYAAGRFDQAIQGFNSFLHQHAHSEYAGNAQYWLGECFYSQSQFMRAIDEFQRTVERYPQGSKTPDALFKMALALNQIGQARRAQDTLQILRSRYPNSPAARKSLERTN